MRKENETLDDIRKDIAESFVDTYWGCDGWDTESFNCDECQQCCGQSPKEYYGVMYCWQGTTLDVIERTKDALQREYEERAYQYYKCKENHGGNADLELMALSEVLDVSYNRLKEKFKQRYKVEHDSLDKIREDVKKSAMLLQDGDDVGTFIHIGQVESLINRAIAVMERDK